MKETKVLISLAVFLVFVTSVYADISEDEFQTRFNMLLATKKDLDKLRSENKMTEDKYTESISMLGRARKNIETQAFFNQITQIEQIIKTAREGPKLPPEESEERLEGVEGPVEIPLATSEKLKNFGGWTLVIIFGFFIVLSKFRKTVFAKGFTPLIALIKFYDTYVWGDVIKLRSLMNLLNREHQRDKEEIVERIKLLREKYKDPSYMIRLVKDRSMRRKEINPLVKDLKQIKKINKKVRDNLRGRKVNLQKEIDFIKGAEVDVEEDIRRITKYVAENKHILPVEQVEKFKRLEQLDQSERKALLEQIDAVEHFHSRLEGFVGAVGNQIDAISGKEGVIKLLKKLGKVKGGKTEERGRIIIENLNRVVGANWDTEKTFYKSINEIEEQIRKSMGEIREVEKAKFSFKDIIDRIKQLRR